jgi:hypothetical protein
MHQDLYTRWRANRNRVLPYANRDDFAGTRRVQCVAGRVDRNTVTEHALREHGVRHFVEWSAPALQG